MSLTSIMSRCPSDVVVSVDECARDYARQWTEDRLIFCSGRSAPPAGRLRVGVSPHEAGLNILDVMERGFRR